jgi:hypothetical protein
LPAIDLIIDKEEGNAQKKKIFFSVDLNDERQDHRLFARLAPYRPKAFVVDFLFDFLQ